MAQTGLPVWSQTAASNATADANINYAEGMAPSGVNDSARAMMAALAKWRDDNSGALTTGGTTTAYTVTTSQTFDSLSSMSGQTLRVKFNATNGASPTLNVDSLGAKAIHSVTGTAIGTGAIKANAIYNLVYDNSNSCWVLIGGNPAEFASGTVMIFQQSSAPTGWTKNTTTGTQHALRLTTDNVTTGGTADFTTVFSSRTIAQANLPSYTLPNTLGVTGSVTFNGQNYVMDTVSSVGGNPDLSNFPRANNLTGLTASFSGSVTGSITSGGSGTAMDFAVKYVDVIRATKD